MILMYFTERPYRYVPEDEVIKHGAFFGLPNRFFDRDKAAQLYDEYLNEAVYAEEMGFDAVMLNEHHGTPFCMGAVMNDERGSFDPRPHHQQGQNRPAREPAPYFQESAARCRGTGDYRLYLSRAASARMGAWRR
jgi:hypothetical protein